MVLLKIPNGKCLESSLSLSPNSLREQKFENRLIDEPLKVFGMTRFLSQVGCFDDNTATESASYSFKLNWLIMKRLACSGNWKLKREMRRIGRITIIFIAVSITKHLWALRLIASVKIHRINFVRKEMLSKKPTAKKLCCRVIWLLNFWSLKTFDIEFLWETFVRSPSLYWDFRLNFHIDYLNETV